MGKYLKLCLLCSTVAACGEVEGGGKAPHMVRGGGVGQGPISGVVNVFVIDEDTDDPVAGASVRVGAAAAPTPCTATTDSTGLAIFNADNCPGLKGPQTVTASTASGYAPSTWIGVNGSNLTMGLTPAVTAAVETATVEGTIDKWSTLPAPAVNHTTLAIIGYTQTDRLGDPANEIVQGKRPVVVALPGMNTIDIDANHCVRNALVDDCNWKLVTRTGRQAHFAVILDFDSKGTPNDATDDTFTVIGWAVKTGLSFSAGQTSTGESLAIIPDTDMTNLTLAFASAPAGLDNVAALPLLDLGEEGRLFISAPPLNPMSLTTRVPKPTGALATGKYDVVGIAQDAVDKDQPGTLKWLRQVNIANTITIDRWLPPPSGISASAGTYSFTGLPEALVHGVEIDTPAGVRAWSVSIFDKTMSFTLPGLSPDPLPAGMLHLKVNAIEIPGVDINNVAFDVLWEKLTRLSSDQVVFMH